MEAGDVTAKRHRIAAIKAFCSWLREEAAVLTTAGVATLALEARALLLSPSNDAAESSEHRELSDQ